MKHSQKKGKNIQLSKEVNSNEKENKRKKKRKRKGGTKGIKELAIKKRKKEKKTIAR